MKFIQRDACKDKSKHLFTFIYKFYSPVTKYHYILKAERFEGDVFVVKFYCKKDRRSDYKYSNTINKKDLENIMMSCLSVIPKILEDYPSASFGFTGARGVDLRTKRKEKRPITQRYAVYKYIASTVIGQKTFEHFAYDQASSYLLINRRNADVNEVASVVVDMFRETFNGFDEIQL